MLLDESSRWVPCPNDRRRPRMSPPLTTSPRAFVDSAVRYATVPLVAPMNFIRTLTASLLLCTPWASWANCPDYVRFVPEVILDDGDSTTRLEVMAGTDADSVTLTLLPTNDIKVGNTGGCTGGGDVQLFDDGSHGDARAGDGLYTVGDIKWDTTGSVASPCASFANTGITPMFSGYAGKRIGAILIEDAGQEFLINGPPVLHVLSAERFVANDHVVKVAPNIQVASHAINMESTERVLAKNFIAEALDLRRLAQEFFRTFPDRYDFLHLIEPQETILEQQSGSCSVPRPGSAHGTLVQHVTGIGTSSAVDLRAAYGSAGRLKGFNQIRRGHIEHQGVFVHEIMHEWAAFLDPSFGLGDGVHWSPNSSMASPLGGCVWQNNEDGTKTILGSFFNFGQLADFDLYLMGLLPESEVQSAYVAGETDLDCNQRGRILSGPFREITISDVVARHGTRSPSAENAQREFRTGMVVYSDGRLLSALEMTFYNRISQLFDGLVQPDPEDGRPPLDFSSITARRGSVSTRVALTGSGPTLSIGPAFFVFDLSAEAPSPLPQELAIINSRGGTLEYSVSSDASWVLLDDQAEPRLRAAASIPLTGAVGPAGESRISVAIQERAALELGVGTHEAVVSVVSGSDRRAIPVRLVIKSLPIERPQLAGGGIVNAASFSGGPVAPGEIISIYGSGLGPPVGVGAELDGSGRVSTEVADVVVQIDGLPAPLFFVREDQINAQVPYTVVPGSGILTVTYEGRRSVGMTVAIAEAAPGVFAHQGDSDRAIVVNPSDGTLNSPSNPSKRGGVVVFYATGEGQTDPPSVDGQRAGSPFPVPRLPVSVRIGGAEADILFAGSAPGFTGLMQVNVQVPSQAVTGSAVPLELAVGSIAAPTVTLSLSDE